MGVSGVSDENAPLLNGEEHRDKFGSTDDVEGTAAAPEDEDPERRHR